MNVIQAMKVKSNAGQVFDVILQKDERTGRFSVLMTDIAFPHGTTFGTADEGFGAALKAIRGVIAENDRLASVYSMPVEEHLDRPGIDRLMFILNADTV